MLTTFVIGLREGLEAALIVGIIAAFLIRGGHRNALRPMWWGVFAAVALSAGGAVLLHIANRSLTLRSREIFEGVLTLLAVVGVTYMIVWMRRHARQLKTELESRAGDALRMGSIGAIVAMAFIAVIREGLETAIFLLATIQGANNPALLGLGAALGIVLAIGIGYGIYKGGVHLDLRKFFRITGVLLIIVAAGLTAKAVHEFAEAGLITSLQGSAIDLSWLIDPGTVRAALLTAFVGFQPVPTWAEVIAWAAFLVPTMIYFLRTPKTAPPAPQVGNGKGKTAVAAGVLALALVAVACTESNADATPLGATLQDDAITLSTDTVAEGRIRFDIENEGSLVHELEVFGGATLGETYEVKNSKADLSGLKLVDEVEDIVSGSQAKLTVSLKPGTYLIVCNLPGHYEAGVATFLTVTEATG